MQPKILYQPFELQVSDLEHWDKQPLVYHFFEIVHIMEGQGTREVNMNKLSYTKGNTFLFTPLDCRGFQSNVPTRFCSIRFSEVFLSQYKQEQERERINRWLKQLEHIFSQHNRFQKLQITDEADNQLVDTLVKSMVQEYAHKQDHYQENMQHFISLLLNILARNVSDGSIVTANDQSEEPLINRMLVHIRRHISDPEQLRIEHLAALFNLSATYVSEYFRKFTGESPQQYILQYKIKLVEQRLSNSELTIGQIADELGFTDESHLSRQFKKYYGISPANYRKKEDLLLSGKEK